MRKVLVDQIIASPIVISLFFVTLGVMRREKMEETMTEIRQKFLRLYKAEWVCILFSSCCTFLTIPFCTAGGLADSTSHQLLDITFEVQVGEKFISLSLHVAHLFIISQSIIRQHHLTRL
jgi:peptidoglycan/LPS O-acetylase OafA/YrhL